MSKNVLFLGDSLTAGEIGAAYISYITKNVNTINRGLNGDTVAGALSRLKRIADRAGLMNVDTAVVQIGINDIICEGYGFEDDSFENNYKEILEIITDNGLKLITIGLTIVEYPGFPLKLLDTGNEIIRRLTKEHDGIFIDILALQSEAQERSIPLTIDGCHFTWQSAKLLGESVNEWLKV